MTQKKNKTHLRENYDEINSVSDDFLCHNACMGAHM